MTTTATTIRTTNLYSNELTCPSCIAKIETRLAALDGVEKGTVHFSTGRIEIVHDGHQRAGGAQRAGSLAQLAGDAVPSIGELVEDGELVAAVPGEPPVHIPVPLGRALPVGPLPATGRAGWRRLDAEEPSGDDERPVAVHRFGAHTQHRRALHAGEHDVEQ